MLGSEIVLIIVGNKLDLEHDRNVSIEEAERLHIIIKIYRDQIVTGFYLF